MSNQAFLVCSDKRIVYPSLNQPRFSSKQQVIACGDWMVPVFWLALFRDREIRECKIPFVGESGRDVELRTSSPICHCKFAAKRLAQATDTLRKTFPKVSTWENHAQLFLQAIQSATKKRPFLSIEWGQIQQLEASRPFHDRMRWLMRFFAGETVRAPQARLRNINGIKWHRKFPDPKSEDQSDADDLNLAAFLGSDYERPAPWWPAPSPPKKKSAKKKSAKKSRQETPQPDHSIEELLEGAIEANDEQAVRKILKRPNVSLDRKECEPLLEKALIAQDHGRYTKIPDLLLKKGIRVSQKAICSAATSEATLAQFKAIMSRPETDPARSSTTIRSHVKAPPLYWTGFDSDQNRAAKKTKILIEAGVPVDVRDSTGDWVLTECHHSPARAKLLIPQASRKHKLAALDYSLARGYGRSTAEEADQQAKQLISFVRALHRSGLKEAEGCDKQILAKREDWEPLTLQPYPYGPKKKKRSARKKKAVKKKAIKKKTR